MKLPKNVSLRFMLDICETCTRCEPETVEKGWAEYGAPEQFVIRCEHEEACMNAVTLLENKRR